MLGCTYSIPESRAAGRSDSRKRSNASCDSQIDQMCIPFSSLKAKWYSRPSGALWPASSSLRSIRNDPGTTVIFEGDTVYVNGQSVGSATEYRQQAAQLATPTVSEIPVPEPAPEGQPQTWLPLGVWALTQQEQGDANMFFQLSSDKNGLVAGAFKNVMTGDEEPVVGQVDLKTQRIAWTIGDKKSPVYETGLFNLTQDETMMLVHFGKDRTQQFRLFRVQQDEDKDKK